MVLLIIVASLIISTGGDDSFLDLLPGDGVPPGWQRAAEQRLLEGKSLYSHINGGAELYYEHGFQKLAIGDYAKGDFEIRIEIYDMGSAEGAAGIFADNTKGLETGSQTGEACSVDDLQILFHRGNYYVSVTCFEIDKDLKKAISVLAVVLDQKIKTK